MNVTLNQLGGELFSRLGQLSVELALLAALVLLASRLLPLQSPALRHFLWVVVLLKPIVAFAISSPWTLFAPLALILQPEGSLLRYAPSLASVEISNTVAVANVRSASLLMAGWLAAVWAAGVAILLGRMLVGYGVIWKLRRRARVHSNGYLFNVLQQTRRALRVNTYVGVATSDVVRSPIVMGIFRPLIVIPAELLDKLRADELELVLMHELAHVRRLDNLTLLLQRLVVALLFFHPAAWLCGRMLQREAEQACDDLVVNATGRPEAYACGLTSVAELAQLKSHLKRRIPMMNVFAAAESDLALRIRRTLHGGASRMGTRSRVLAGLMLFALAAVTLPSAGIAQTGERVAGEGDRETHDMDLDAIGLRIREAIERGDITPEEGREKWAEVQRQAAQKRDEGALDLDAIGLKIREAVANGDITAEEGRERMEAARRRAAGGEGKQRSERVWRAAMATDPDEWSEELKAAILELKPDSTIEKIADGIRQRQALVESKRGEERVWRAAMATDPDEWSEELKAAILELKPDSTIEKIADGIRQRQALMEGKRGEKGDRLRDFQRGVIERAMAEAPDEWSDELKAAIERAGWDLQEFTEGVRQRQAAGTTVTDFSQILIDLATSVEETSWGQVKEEVKEVDEDK